MSECNECIKLKAKQEQAHAELEEALVWRSLMLMRGKPSERSEAERGVAAARDLVKSCVQALEAHRSAHGS
jgi:hypothetical protein